MENTFAQHSHRINDLRISRQRLGRGIGLGRMQACLAQTLRSGFLIDHRNHRQRQSRNDGDEAKIPSPWHRNPPNIEQLLRFSPDGGGLSRLRFRNSPAFAMLSTT
jgi:hypothetical protein